VPSRITWTFYGEAQLDRTLGRVEVAAADVSPAWEVIAEQFLAAEREQFASEGGFGSGGWAPLSEHYAAWKAVHYPGEKILHRTGELEASLTEGPEIRVIEAHMMVLGSAVEYGRFHQGGGPNLPRRRPIELPEMLRRSWIKVVQRYLVTGGLRPGGEIV
jgi:phage gpG-like protein